MKPAHEIETHVRKFLREKHAHLDEMSFAMRGCLRDDMNEALRDGIVTAEEYEAAKVANSDYRWTWARNN